MFLFTYCIAALIHKIPPQEIGTAFLRKRKSKWMKGEQCGTGYTKLFECYVQVESKMS